MKTRKNPFLYSEKIVSPHLQDIWKEISCLPCPRTITAYLCAFSRECVLEVRQAQHYLSVLENPNIIEISKLEKIESTLALFVSYGNSIQFELRQKYRLSIKNTRFMRKLVFQNESTWDSLCMVIQKMYQKKRTLRVIIANDHIPLEIPYTFNFSKILKDFQRELFQKN